MSTRNLRYLVPTSAPTVDTHEWATVTQTTPLRIQLDIDTAPLPFTPITLEAGLVITNRVLVLLMANDSPRDRSRRVVVLGKPK